MEWKLPTDDKIRFVEPQQNCITTRNVRRTSLGALNVKIRRKLNEYVSATLVAFLVLSVFVYKFSTVAKPDNIFNLSRRNWMELDSNKTSRSFAIKERKSFVALWDPSPLEKTLFSAPVRERYTRRTDILHEECGASNEDLHWSDEMQLITVPDRQLAVCYVQKAGSTSWQKLIYKLRHAYDKKPWVNTGHMENRAHAKNLKTDVKSELMSNPDATRVLCARHPFARLVSGWNNKFHKNFISRAGNVMLRSMPEIVKYIGLTEPTDPDHIISFRDFLHFITDKGLSQVDVHFRSIRQLCQPCSFPYNVIVKAETAPEDLWWVLNRFNGSMDSFPIHVIPDYGDSEKPTDSILGLSFGPESQKSPLHFVDHKFIIDTVRRQFKTVPTEIIRKLVDLYASDFDLFGYTFDIDTLTAGGFY